MISEGRLTGLSRTAFNHLAGNFFFLLYLSQVLVYTLVAPLATGRSTELVINTFLLFTVPLVVSYGVVRKFWPSRGAESVVAPAPLEVPNTAKIILGLLFLQLIGVFADIVVGFDIRRVSTTKTAWLVAQVPIPLWGFLRFRDLAVFPAVLFLLFGRSSLSLKQDHKLLLWLAVVNMSANAAFGSRSFFVFVFVFALGLAVHSGLITFTRSSLTRLAVAMVLAVYGLLVTSNLRWAPHDLFNPVASFRALGTKVVMDQWVARVDGLQLIELSQPGLKSYGFYHGALWKNPVVATLGGAIGLERAKELKSQARTTSKSQLLSEMTLVRTLDFQSSILTDLYGNFGYWGFPVAGAMLGVLFVLALNGLAAGPVVGFVSFLGIMHMFIIEQECINLLIGWLRLIPVVLVFYLVTRTKLWWRRRPVKSG